MEYTVKSKANEINNLIEIFKVEKFEYKNISNEEVIVNLDSIEKEDYFIRLISTSIALNMFFETIKKKKEQFNWDDEIINEYVEEETDPFPPYYTLLTEIKVREYLKKSSTINLESFKKFNVPGFEAEVTKLIETYMQYVEEDLNIDEIFDRYFSDAEDVDDDYEYDENDENDSNYSVNETKENFKILENKVYEQGLSRLDYESLIVKFDETYRVFNLKNEEITTQLLEDLLNIKIQVKTTEEIDADDKFIHFLALINFACSIFKPETIIISKSLMVLEINAVHKNVKAQMALIGHSITVEITEE